MRARRLLKKRLPAKRQTNRGKLNSSAKRKRGSSARLRRGRKRKRGCARMTRSESGSKLKELERLKRNESARRRKRRLGRRRKLVRLSARLKRKRRAKKRSDVSKKRKQNRLDFVLRRLLRLWPKPSRKHQSQQPVRPTTLARAPRLLLLLVTAALVLRLLPRRPNRRREGLRDLVKRLYRLHQPMLRQSCTLDRLLDPLVRLSHRPRQPSHLDLQELQAKPLVERPSRRLHHRLVPLLDRLPCQHHRKDCLLDLPPRPPHTQAQIRRMLQQSAVLLQDPSRCLGPRLRHRALLSSSSSSHRLVDRS